MDRYMDLVKDMQDSVLTRPGATDPSLRRAVEARAAALGGRAPAETGELPADLAPYVEKVARHAYKVTPEDVEGLLEAGYSEDAVFELTLCAATGAGLSRLERGLAALRGGA